MCAGYEIISVNLFCSKGALFLGGEWSLVTSLVFKTSEPVNPAGGFDSHPPPPITSPTINFCSSVGIELLGMWTGPRYAARKP